MDKYDGKVAIICRVYSDGYCVEGNPYIFEEEWLESVEDNEIIAIPDECFDEFFLENV